MSGKHNYTIHVPGGRSDLDMSRYAAIIERPEMQRLKDVQQVPFADFVYPMFTHDRLEHSLGTFYMASISADILGLGEEDAEILKVASLIHDTGHSALSHVMECITGEKNNNVSAENVRKMSDAISGVSDPEKVIEAIAKNGHYLSHAISTIFGTDKLDYMYRDAFYAGIKGFGKNSMKILHDALLVDTDSGKQYCVSMRAADAVSDYIRLWEKLRNDVYFNPETIKARAMAERAALSELSGSDEKSLLGMTDDELYSRLAESGNPVVRNIIWMIGRKETYDTVLGFKKNGHTDTGHEFPTYAIGDVDTEKILWDFENTERKERELADSFGIPYGTLILSPGMIASHISPRDKGGLMLGHDNKISKFEDVFSDEINWADRQSDMKYIFQVTADPAYRDAVVSGFSGRDPRELVFS
ncbi:MAG: HD domain-containing protein [Candidatus Aenigmarchaeota archaeon]|nr:HD domain-containing protein [Candidatus Aenigmarchaeota archaeon]